jgi:glutaredoxin 3
MAKSLLDDRLIEYDEIDVTDDPTRLHEMQESSGHHSAPQIVISGQPIGGWEELSLLDASGALDRLMALDPTDALAIRRIVA